MQGQTKLLLPHSSGLKTVEEYDSLEALIACVGTGRGVTLVYQILSRIRGRLVLRPLKPSPQPPPIVMVYRKESFRRLSLRGSRENSGTEYCAKPLVGRT
jgi:DNA-binding transcriptional LysR family regulator